MDSKYLTKVIEDYFDQLKQDPYFGKNELLFGYCNNGEYNLNLVDIELLSEHILSKLNEVE